MTTPITTFVQNFVTGVRNGLAAPFSAFNPPRVHTKIDPRLLEPSYRPLSEDKANIRNDFNQAVATAQKECSAKSKTSKPRRLK